MSNQSRQMTKVEAMDNLMETFEKGINSSEIIHLIHHVFKFDLESTPNLPTLPRAAIDAYLEHCGNKVTGAEIRMMINQNFGINLEALSALEGARISIYSKSQWMLRHDQDLFEIHTGIGDVDVRMVPTTYFTEQTGSRELPMDLINALTTLGFYYEEESGGYYFSNPAGEPVPDAFKGQTMMAIRKAIHQSYSHL